MASADPKIIIVTRKTRLEEVLERFQTRGQAMFLIGRAHQIEGLRRGAPSTARRARATRAAPENPSEGDFSEYQAEHDAYRHSLETLEKDLDFGVQIQKVDRSFLPNLVFGLPAGFVIGVTETTSQLRQKDIARRAGLASGPETAHA